ncbi:PulJ/GspJ family protein [Methylobacterium nonmethylotrophicum]|uniref:Prepilin-type N-terminal cleavage/methylation domain-containing protein n=1 Tax=Methylobacterium nonmethylotrophicum TaxID=1141884 RepID=A0A4Z0NVF1_9HYPH|nr:prepilin-type N-terminal cleavage/methylation domain-containing protein [Methylobacterium nonmethylotrophicum]TGE01040.1 prepilin-type N-terminal cleavage/methylation domain-containing protein [Methylobacterium nonmethylotrophicum]
MRQGSAGFTLLEVLIALMISAMALAALTHLVQDAAGLDARLSVRARSADETQALFALLEDLLLGPEREMTLKAAAQPAASPESSVSGTDRAIRIVSRGPRILGLMRPAPFRLAFEPTEADRGRIVLRWPSPAGGTDRETVMADVRSFRIRYAEAAQIGIRSWHDHWSGSVAGLAMVEISLVDAATGHRQSRTIPVASTLPQICVLQPLTSGCPQWN